MRRLAELAAILVLTTLAYACSNPGASASRTHVSPPPDAVRLAARQMAFDQTALSAPANRPFTLVFENLESAPHNVSLRPQTGGRTAFVGDVFPGPATRVHEVPALDAGPYVFRCDLHPAMQGILTAL